MRWSRWQEQSDWKQRANHKVWDSCEIETMVQQVEMRGRDKEFRAFMVISCWHYLELDSKLGISLPSSTKLCPICKFLLKWFALAAPWHWCQEGTLQQKDGQSPFMKRGMLCVLHKQWKIYLKLLTKWSMLKLRCLCGAKHEFSGGRRAWMGRSFKFSSFVSSNVFSDTSL